MIIKLDDSLIDKASKNTFSTEEVRCLNSICLSRARGYNFVIGSRELITHLTKLDALSDDSKSIFRTIYNDQTRWHQLLNKFSFILIIKSQRFAPYSYEDNSQVNLCVSLDDFLTYSLDSKVNVIAEHLNDIRFYEGMVRSYFSHINIRGVNFVYKKVLGGGSTTHEVIDELYQGLDGISLCILDRDNTSPYITIGETAHKVIKSIPKNHFSRYHVIQSRELENIIPSKMMSDMFRNSKVQRQKLQKFQQIRNHIKNNESPIKYVDFKKGVKLSLTKCVGCENSRQYWNEVLSDSGFDTNCSFKEECTSPKQCKSILIDGFGTDLLKSSVEHINDNEFDFNDIDNDTSSEWNILCQKIAPYMISPQKKSA